MFHVQERENNKWAALKNKRATKRVEWKQLKINHVRIDATKRDIYTERRTNKKEPDKTDINVSTR